MLLGYGHSNRKSSTTHSYLCEQYCFVSIISVYQVVKNTIRTKQHARAKLRWRAKTLICFWLSYVVLTKTRYPTVLTKAT